MEQNPALTKEKQKFLSPVLFISMGMPTIIMDKQNKQHQSLQQIGDFLNNFSFQSVIIITNEYVKPDQFHVTSKSKHIAMQDHPYEQYHNIDYEFNGSPEISKKIRKMMKQEELECQADDEWGLDHAAWMPLSIMFPKIKWPVIQISMQPSFDEDQHGKLAKVLFQLRKENNLIIFSGGLTGNQQFAFRTLSKELQPKIKKEEYQKFQQFHQVIHKIITTYKGMQKQKFLKNLTQVPYLSEVHPYQDKFMPLYLALQITQGSVGNTIYQELYKGSISLNCYIFDQ